MSLLMKALQKAAQNREHEDKPDVKPAASAQPELELELEPFASKTPSSFATGDFDHATPAYAATVLQAGEPQDNWFDALRNRPVLLFAIAAGLFMAGYATYVYIQIKRPNILVGKAPIMRPATPPTPAAIATTPIAQTPPEPSASPETASPTSEIAGDIEQKSAQPEPPKPEAPRAAEQTTTARMPTAKARDSVVVKRSDETGAAPNPLLSEAYRLLQQGSLDAARGLYQKHLTDAPRSVDALLGLAAIATQEKEADLASKYYLQILELEPKHTLAQTGLLAMIGKADPASAETRLKQLASREPSAFVYFTLGNLYAEQSQWSAAQQAYFQAYHLEPGNADYAFNLAVGLEHLGQTKVALDYYRRALALAGATAQAHFDLTAARNRIRQLESHLE